MYKNLFWSVKFQITSIDENTYLIESKINISRKNIIQQSAR